MRKKKRIPKDPHQKHNEVPGGDKQEKTTVARNKHWFETEAFALRVEFRPFPPKLKSFVHVLREK
jgi:hypothetical protein